MSSDAAMETLTLKAAGIVLIDCDHRTPPAVQVGYPYIAIPQLKDGHITLDGVRRISESDYLDWTKKLLPQGNDVIVVRRCNSGESAHIPVGLKCAIGQNLVVLRADGERVLPQYLRWLLRGNEWWSEVGKYINVGAVFDSLRCRDIPNFELPIPSLKRQREIALILANLDDRITLLRETNTTLESIAQALFKSWFVDFDPVRAKMEGRQPEGMDEETAALFPDGFEESGLGLMPKGWRIKTIGDVVQAVGGATPSTKNLELWEPGLIHWTSPKDLSNAASPMLLDTERRISQEGLEKIGSGLLPVGALLMSSRAPIGYLAITNIPVAINQGYIAIPPGGALPPLFMYFWVKWNMAIIKGHANGSTFMEISKKAFRLIPILLPPANIVDKFCKISHTLFNRIGENERQARALAGLRDALLPRLISGRLRLSEIETVPEEYLR